MTYVRYLIIFFVNISTLQFASFNDLLQQAAKQNNMIVSTSNPDGSNLSGMFNTMQTESQQQTVIHGSNTTALQTVLGQQQSPEYQSAMAILNNSVLQQEYQNSMLSIQMFFLQYATKTVATLSSQVLSPSLSDVLNALSTASGHTAISTPISSLSTLLSGISINKTTTTPTTTQMDTALNMLIQKTSKQSLTTTTQSAGLQLLLDAVKPSSSVSNQVPSDQSMQVPGLLFQK